MSGKNIAHVVQNFNIFLCNDEFNNIFYDDGVVGHIIKAGTKSNFQVNKGTKIFLYGIPSAVVSTIGLKWELNDTELTFLGFASSFNVSLVEKITVNVKSGLCMTSIVL
jgi:thiamine pyrophosphokinase